MTKDTFASYDAASLPAPIIAYLDAHEEHRYADAMIAFAPDATVIDDGNTYRGIDAISAWVETSSAEYAYTSTRIGQAVSDDEHAVVQVRLDGNFPGGTVVLRYQFQLAGSLIERLTIEV